MVRSFVLLAAYLSISVVTLAQPADRPLLISRVSINQSHIAFTYAGKIWDYLLKVNDQTVGAEKNLLTYFENTVGRPTKITVSATASGANARTYTVFPALGENRLRRANWAEENRKLVDKLSGGRLGYIFIEGYGGEGIANAIRGLTGYADKAGIIVDQRFNGGGITPDYLIEWMQRKPLYYYMFRGGDDIATPVNPAPPVKCCS